jgi:hypothetical protein
MVTYILWHLVIRLECEAYTNLRNELNSDITTQFCGQNVDASFTGLPPHGKMMFLIGDLGYKFYNMNLYKPSFK